MLAFTQKKENISILDVGCGIGHFYQFLKENKLIDTLKITYKGIDISKKMIDFARKKFPGVEFEVIDLVDDKFDEKFDYVFCSGVFNLRMAELEPHYDSVRQMISRMFNLCNCGLSVNFLAKSAAYFLPDEKDHEDRYVFFPEEEVIKWVRAVWPQYILRKDYHPGDFTVYMLK